MARSETCIRDVSLCIHVAARTIQDIDCEVPKIAIEIPQITGTSEGEAGVGRCSGTLLLDPKFS